MSCTAARRAVRLLIWQEFPRIALGRFCGLQTTTQQSAMESPVDSQEGTGIGQNTVSTLVEALPGAGRSTTVATRDLDLMNAKLNYLWLFSILLSSSKKSTLLNKPTGNRYCTAVCMSCNCSWVTNAVNSENRTQIGQSEVIFLRKFCHSPTLLDVAKIESSNMYSFFLVSVVSSSFFFFHS